MLVETRLYFVLCPSLEEVTGMALKETKQVRITTKEIPREHHKKTCLFSTFCGNWLLFTPLKGQENEKAWRVNRIALCLLSRTGDRELRSLFLRTQLRALRGRRCRKEILSVHLGSGCVTKHQQDKLPSSLSLCFLTYTWKWFNKMNTDTYSSTKNLGWEVFAPKR